MQQKQAYYIHHETNKHNWFGLAGTILFHSTIFLVLYFFVLTPPNPPWADGGTSMILGEENMGGPSLTAVQNPQIKETYTEIKSEPTPDELSQSTDDDVDVIAKKNEDKKTTKPVITPPTERPKDEIVLPRKADVKSLFRKKTNGEAGGYGSGTEPGNEGSPDGKIDGILGGTGTGTEGNGTGSGPAGIDGGSGVKFKLTGRRVAVKPTISANSKDVGIVVVNITVDRAGNVIKAEAGARGTTTLNADKLKAAKQAALSTKFSPKSDGPEEQYGTMTVNFTFE